MRATHVSVWDAKDYLSYLKAFFQKQGQTRRGIKADFARAAGCSTAYLSHVLAGNAQLTPEQALASASFLGLSPVEQRYFFYLVLWDRAGTPELRKTFEEELKSLRQKRANIAERLSLNDKPAPAVESQYYSQWYYSAVRICLYMPVFRDLNLLARALHLRPETVRKVIEFLKEARLVEDSKQGLVPTAVNFHLDENAPSIQKHHSHWRLKALQSLEQKNADDVHYTSIISVSHKDREVVQEILLKAIKDIRQVVGDSQPEEGVHCYTIDFFPVAIPEKIVR